MPTSLEVLQEFVKDIEVVEEAEPGSVESDWPDLMETYRKAKRVLASQFPKDIELWLAIGELLDEGGAELPRNTNELLDDLGSRLDRICSHEVTGNIIFWTSGGGCYVASIEGHIGEINPEYLKEMLEDREESMEEYESCAEAERKLKQTLRWVERLPGGMLGKRWYGFPADSKSNSLLDAVAVVYDKTN